MKAPINKIKKCVNCNKRLSGKHHYFCDDCWEKRHREKLKEKTIRRMKK